MKCVHCQNELNEDVRKCPNCGMAVSINDNNQLGAAKKSIIGPSVGTINADNINSQNNKNKIKNSNTKKAYKRPIIISIVLILLIIFIACSFYFLVFNSKSSKQIFVDGFKRVTSKLLKTNDVKRQSIQNTIKYNISGNGLENVSDIYNNLVLNNNINIDKDLKKMDEELSINYDGSNIGLGIYARDSKAYLSIMGLYDKLIEIPVYSKQYKKFSTQEIKDIKNALDNAVESSIDDKYFRKSKKTISINDKNKKVNAYTFTINNNNVKDITKKFITSLCSSENVMSVLTNAFNLDKKTLRNYINKIDYSSINLENPIEITIYTKKFTNSYIGIEISLNTPDSKLALRYLIIDDMNSELIIDAGITSFKVKINKTGTESNSKTKFDLDLMGMMKINVVSEMIKSKNVEFKNIDTSKTIGYDEFMSNDINDVINNINNNDKIKELISMFSN